MKQKKGFVESVALGILELLGKQDYEVRTEGNLFKVLDADGTVISSFDLSAAKAVSHDPEMVAGFWYANI